MSWLDWFEYWVYPLFPWSGSPRWMWGFDDWWEDRIELFSIGFDAMPWP